MEQGVDRLQCDRPVMAIQPLVEQSDRRQLPGQMVVGLRAVGRERDDIAPSLGRLRQPAGQLEGDRESDADRERFRVDRDRRPAVAEGDLGPAQLAQHAAEANMRQHIVGS